MPHAGISGTYDTGLATSRVSDTGQLSSGASYGYTVNWGISGTHHWRHTDLAMDYSGSVNGYAQTTAYNSVNQNMMLGVGHQFTKHMHLSLRESAGMSSRNYAIGGYSETTPFDPASSYIPRTDFFDNRTVYATSTVDLTIQKTARLSFNFNGTGFLNNRQSHSLTDAWGLLGGADVQYRFSRRTTIGAMYTYQHFYYQGTGGGTDAHYAAGSYSIALGRTWEFSANAGAMRIESKFIQIQQIDPVIVALLGVTSTQQIAYNLRYTPAAAGRISKRMRRGVAYISASRGITPGNGLFLTSVTNAVLGGYSYTAFRRWSTNFQAGYVNAASEGFYGGTYGNTTASVSTGRQLGRHFNVSASYTARKYQSGDYSRYNRRIDTVALTLGYSPGELRLAAR